MEVSAGMWRRAFLLIPICAALGLTPAAAVTGKVPTATSAPAPARAGELKSRQIQFVYDAFYTNLPKEAEVFDFWLPLPAETLDQKIKEMSVTSPYDSEMASDETGNRIFHTRAGRRGGLPMQIKVKFRADRHEVRSGDLTHPLAVKPATPANLETWLKADRLVPLDGETKTLATQVTKDAKTHLQKARAIYDYVVRTMKPMATVPGWGQGDLRFVLKEKGGTSLDIVTAFVGLARAAGIPARNVLGFKIPDMAMDGTLSEYHAWAEFWLDGVGWVPVDPVLAIVRPATRDYYFGSLDPDRIQFSIGRDLTLIPPQNADPINFLLYPYAEMQGQPLTGNAYRFTWSQPPPEEPKPEAAAPAAAPKPKAKAPAAAQPSGIGVGAPPKSSDPNSPPPKKP
jgi:transglutaminase-like putative cysteine protease